MKVTCVKNLPDGIYEAVVCKVEEKKMKNGTERILIELEPNKQELEGNYLNVFMWVSEKVVEDSTEFNLFLLANIDLKESDVSFKKIKESLLGIHIGIAVTNNVVDGRNYANVVDVFEAEEVDERISEFTQTIEEDDSDEEFDEEDMLEDEDEEEDEDDEDFPVESSRRKSSIKRK